MIRQMLSARFGWVVAGGSTYLSQIQQELLEPKISKWQPSGLFEMQSITA